MISQLGVTITKITIELVNKFDAIIIDILIEINLKISQKP